MEENQKDFIAILRKNCVYILNHPKPESETGQYKVSLIDVIQKLPKPYDKNQQLISCVCMGVAPSLKMLIVADSEKFIYVIKFSGESWNVQSPLKTRKRVIKIYFSPNMKYVLFTDKTGDIFSIELSKLALLNVQEPSLLDKHLSLVLGHCSFILDSVISANSEIIYSCDKDEKIRVSKFPEGYDIDTFFLGHTNGIISLNLVKDDQILVSVSHNGEVKFWDCEVKNCVGTLHLNDRASQQIPVKKATVTEINSAVFYLAYERGDCLIVGEIKMVDYEFKLLHETKIDQENDLIDLFWQQNSLFSHDDTGLTKHTFSEDFTHKSILLWNMNRTHYLTMISAPIDPQYKDIVGSLLNDRSDEQDADESQEVIDISD